MNLRPYQADAVECVRQCMVDGKRRVLLVSPTGSGKTIMGGEFVQRTIAKNRRVLFIAPRAELVDQAAETFARMGLKVGAACASASTPPNPYAPVQVASVQTLLARNARPPGDMILVDEAHHAVAEETNALLSDYPNALVVGLTATPERGDGRGLGDVFDALVVSATVRELTDMGHLVPCEILRPERALEPGQIAQSPVDAYLEHARGRRTVVFARSIELAEEYARGFAAAGVRSASLSISTPWTNRRLVVDALRRGGIDVVCNVMVLTEGFDAPEVSCIILARGCGSQGLYMQIVGRSLRPAPGKVDALLIDLRGVSHEHGRPEDDREYALEGRGMRLRDPNSYCSVCGSLRVPPDACPACGFAPSRDDTGKSDEITGDKLSKFAQLRERDDDARRAERLGRWMRDAVARGVKVGSAAHKYKAVYGEWPPGVVKRMAEEIARGAA